MLQRTTSQRTFRVAHMFCGVGAGAKGFNDANPRIGHVSARFECAGGIDIDAGAIRNFERITRSRGTVLDLFDAEQYAAFHGGPPPPGWQPAMPADILAAFGPHLDVMFLSAPCKGFSGLLSAAASGTDKYQALNRLTLRGVWLALEAYKDDPIPIILFENVPRIATRGRALLDQIKSILRSFGYVFAETTHDCGEIGGLAQSRKRFLLVARHAEKVPPFLYQPRKSRLRGVGEVIGQLPLPGAEAAGPMHRVPMLQWKTWVRLAFVEAGQDWRSLNRLRVEDGVLADFGIVPDRGMRDNQLGVLGRDETAPTLTGQRSPAQGRFSVADPRMDAVHNETLGVRPWDGAARVLAGASRPANGAHSVADPRPQQANQTFAQYGVRDWAEPAGTVTGQAAPGGGPNSVADPRLTGKPAFNNVFRIVPFDATSPAVAGPGGPAGGLSVADPRPPEKDYAVTKYQVTPYDGASRTVIGASTTGDGAFAVADPRPTHGSGAHHNKMRVVDASAAAPTVTGSDRVGSGALCVADPRPGYSDAHKNVLRVTEFAEPAGTVTSGHSPSNGAICVADPRPTGLNAEGRTGYATQGHYGVIGWDESSNAVPGYAKYDRGNWSIADPRSVAAEPLFDLPAPADRLVARIVALDGTWHRPFTTLELAALQSLFDPGEVFDLEGGSDQLKREWIGNAVPSAAARGMAETIGETLLLASMGETFMLSSREIWTKPLAMALTVDPRQASDEIDA
ncbi:DNA cytosine methyltransferase [Sphingomonas sp. TX0522]|uniref:DNA cytosine methyltransferase n=1 Tax=Sphingomonas sp. TX0522 TaxID=2479205 RepID=UPI0018E0365A|nr:DNA cytosine methyltransferase [Sphingomonas sp. TX0522]MBI0530339.1 DNA cytosine methyltransferase [Sphingomonas sp. TX0522]